MGKYCKIIVYLSFNVKKSSFQNNIYIYIIFKYFSTVYNNIELCTMNLQQVIDNNKCSILSINRFCLLTKYIAALYLIYIMRLNKNALERPCDQEYSSDHDQACSYVCISSMIIISYHDFYKTMRVTLKATPNIFKMMHSQIFYT